MPPNPNLQAQLLTSLLTTTPNLPTPSPTFLATILNPYTSRPPPPLAVLTATARTRLLSSDLTSPTLLDPSYLSTHILPPNSTDPNIRSAVLDRDVCLQVLDIENLSRSRWSQVEDLEALERGEGTRGREIIRLRDDEDENGNGERGVTQLPSQTQTQTQGGAGRATTNAGSEKATHKLVLQDAKGQKIYGLELRKVDRIAIGKLNIGEKMVVKKGTTISRGVIMLEPDKCVVLGGKVEAWHKAWVEGRLARLKEAVQRNGQ